MIRTRVEFVGQKYVDEPVYETVSRPDPVAVLVSNAVSKMTKAPGRPLPVIESLSHYLRTPLNWVKP